MAKTFSTYPTSFDDFSTDRVSGDTITSNSYDVIETALSAIENKLCLGTGLSANSALFSGHSAFGNDSEIDKDFVFSTVHYSQTSLLDIRETITDPTPFNIKGTNVVLTVDLSADKTSGFIGSDVGTVETVAGNNKNIKGMEGHGFTFIHNGGGTITAGYGIEGIIWNAGPGAFTTAYATSFGIENDAGVIGTAIGLDVWLYNTGTINTGYGIRVSDTSPYATVAWNIYSEGANARNLLTNIYGSDLTGGDLHLYSTSHATKGKIYFGATNYYDEANEWFVFQSDQKYFIKQNQTAAESAKQMFYFSNGVLNGVHDPSIFIGYNIDGGKANHQKFYMGLEGNYYDATHYWAEWYLERVDSDGDSYRSIWSGNYDDYSAVAIMGNLISFLGRDNSAQMIITQNSKITTNYDLGIGEFLSVGIDTYLTPLTVKVAADVCFRVRTGGANAVEFYGASDANDAYKTIRINGTNVLLQPDSGGKVGINDPAPGEMLDVGGNINVTGVIKIDDIQVVSNRVIDARIDDAINSGDATTDGVIDAIRDAMITHGLMAAA